MTPRNKRVATRATAIIAVLTALACADRGITDPLETQDPGIAADRLVQMADSVASLQGEGAALPLREAADQLRASRRYSVIPLTVDGKTERWLAFSMQQTVTLQCATVAPTTSDPRLACNTPIVSRTLVAWHPGDPRRVLVLTTQAAPEGGIGNLDRPTTATAVPAFLRYYEGRDQVWFGTTGKYLVNVVEGDPCPAPAASSDARAASAPTCRLARFTWALREVTVGSPSALGGLRPNQATGTHTIALAPSEVNGAIVQITLVPRPPVPPVPPATGLVGDLAVSAGQGSALTFTFTVKNVSDHAIELRFNSSQEYDFIVGDRTGRIFWRWGADQGFPLALRSRVIPSNGSVQYSATWTPTVHGELMVAAMLTSSNLKLAVRSPFTVP